MSKVINLLGGPGIGKSTTAYGLLHYMKSKRISCELVNEYVKDWVYDDKKVGVYDQCYIFGKQSRKEARLYTKVDYIITESPLVLGPVYESYYNGESIIEQAVLKFLDVANRNKIKHLNFVLPRTKAYVTKGRYETEAQAKEVDEYLVEKLYYWGMPFVQVTGDPVAYITKELGVA